MQASSVVESEGIHAVERDLSPGEFAVKSMTDWRDWLDPFGSGPLEGPKGRASLD